MEVMLQSPLISDLIFKGEVTRIKEIMAKSNRMGMQTFDQDLFALYENNKISYAEAMLNADSKNELRLRVKLESKRDKTVAADDSGGLTVMEEEKKAAHY
jgi:twitching motility protein PilU